MSKDCNIVRDLIPLYSEKIASDESVELILNHCKECSDCNRELEIALAEVDKDEQNDKMMQLWKNIEKMERSRRIKKTCVATVCGVIFVLIMFFCTFFVFRGNTWFAKVDLGVAEDYLYFDEMTEEQQNFANVHSKDDIEAAVAAVKGFFETKFGGCILTKLEYCEDNKNEHDAEIVFVSSYYLMLPGPSMDAGMVDYWTWTVNYNSAYQKWEVTNCGYG